MEEGSAVKVFSPEWWSALGAEIVKWLSSSGLKLLIGVVVLIILFKIVNIFARGVRKAMIRKGVEKTIYTVTYSAIRKVLKFLLFMVFLGFVGIETAGIGSIIASAGVAIGLALQGSLSNLAGGLIVLIMHPYRIGDYIEAQGLSGTVEEIRIFYTELTTPDNKVISLPNGALSNGNIINYSKNKLRRVDLKYSIGYAEDFVRAKAAILDTAQSIQEILTKESGAPADPFVKVSDHSASSIDIVTRVWTKKEDYWTVYFNMQEAVKAKFDAESISIPYPQLDVHYNELARVKKAAEMVEKGEDGATPVMRSVEKEYERERAARVVLSEEERRAAEIKALEGQEKHSDLLAKYKFKRGDKKSGRRIKNKEETEAREKEVTRDGESETGARAGKDARPEN